MEYKITGYQPEKLFHYFEEISAIPRGSGNEKGISDYLVAFAKDHNLDVYQDEVYNVIIKKPASAGAEAAAPVMMQGHIDMVCDKLASVEHDFEKDGLDLIVKDGVLTANGTTLGADNGIAVALMMTVLDDDTLAHPALECVFTTDEETGLVGAETLDKSRIDARIMINLDSEEEGIATVSCAGGVVATLTRSITREHMQGSTVTLEVSGLMGGHSGSDIHLERGNGDLILARIVEKLMRTGEPHLVSLSGGTKDNAINREATAVVAYADAESAQQAVEVASALIADIKAELEVFDPGFTCTVTVADGVEVDAMSDADARAFIGALRIAPNGVMRRNVAADGAVEVSSNIGVVITEDAQVTFSRRVLPSHRSRKTLRTVSRRSPTPSASMRALRTSTPAGATRPIRTCATSFRRPIASSSAPSSRSSRSTPAWSAASSPRRCPASMQSPWARPSPTCTRRTRAWSSPLLSASTSCSSTCLPASRSS